MIQKRVRLDEVASYVKGLFINYQIQSSHLIYHNLLHTEKVVIRAGEIASFYKPDENELYILLVAAWFHDCGHLFGQAKDHELRGALKMKEYMEKMDTDEQLVKHIETCILATRLPTNPHNLTEEILCDADLYHLGTSEFYITDMLVKREYELRNNVLAKNWEQNSVMLLQQHKFYTQYCRDRLDKGKLANIRLLQEKINSRN